MCVRNREADLSQGAADGEVSRLAVQQQMGVEGGAGGVIRLVLDLTEFFGGQPLILILLSGFVRVHVCVCVRRM